MNRLRLKDWLKLSNIRRQISENKNVPDNILVALSLSDDDTNYEMLPWKVAGEAFLSLLEVNLVSIDFPILKKMKKRNDNPVPWDYPEREWYFWAHILCKNYGWSLEYVSNLDIDDALALFQEIEVEEHFEREWEYQISEIAYPYDSASKKHKYVPLERPDWMKEDMITKIKIRRIPVSHLPVGNVIKIDGDKEAKPS